MEGEIKMDLSKFCEMMQVLRELINNGGNLKIETIILLGKEYGLLTYEEAKDLIIFWEDEIR